MNQTASAIITLASAILGAGAAVAVSAGVQTAAVILTVLAVATGIMGASSLIRACLYDHDVAVGVYARLDFLEELVYLEKLSLEHKHRTRERRPTSGAGASGTDLVSVERRRRDVA